MFCRLRESFGAAESIRGVAAPFALPTPVIVMVVGSLAGR